ncbi:MAG: metallophosphoesterase [Elusimicrobiota bacterium]
MIGALSDTHNSISAIERAVDFFNEKEVDLVIHAGDFTSRRAVMALSNLNAPFKGVAGNMDNNVELLNQNFRGEGDITPTWRKLNYKQKKIHVVHRKSDHLPLTDAGSGECDIYIYGHTHNGNVEKNSCLKVNPGSCSDRSYKSSVALINPEEMTANLYEI